MSYAVTSILAIILAIGATIAAAILLMPDARAKKLNNFWYTIHNIINFRTLLIEKILKIFYIFSTSFVILLGFLMLFTVERSVFGSSQWMGGAGLLLMILGPIVIRLAYETIMMFILLVNNVAEIRGKLTANERKGEQPAKAPAHIAEFTFCTKCGVRYDKNAGPCPNCKE